MLSFIISLKKYDTSVGLLVEVNQSFFVSLIELRFKLLCKGDKIHVPVKPRGTIFHVTLLKFPVMKYNGF